MSLDTLLLEELTHLRYSAATEDAYGNTTAAWVTAGVVLGRLEQRGAVERTQDRQTVISDWVLALQPHVAVASEDRFVDRFGRTFEVVGAPNMAAAPGRDVYVEVSLRHVAGA